MNKKSIHRSFVIVDIERYGRRSDADQRWLRRQMYDVLQTALDDSGIEWNSCAAADRGDSVMLLVPPDVPKVDITDAFVDRLDRELARYARRAAEPVRMRMRLALHFGEVSEDERGWVGSDLNTACRLADLQAARDALTAAPDANLVVVVSEPWYRSVVNQDAVLVSHFGFREIPFEAKEVSDRAWLHVREAQRSGQRESEDPRAPASSPAGPIAAPRIDAVGFVFSGPVEMRDAIAGDQHNYYDRQEGQS
ncbi:MAG: hypothetical protein QOF58_5994 [Pseudonocardiales bacterium]|jgi:hypothetical protein|nr:hypothetical protein [Pseudonocardiales bacterium]